VLLASGRAPVPLPRFGHDRLLVRRLRRCLPGTGGRGQEGRIGRCTADAAADAGLVSAFGLGTYGNCRESGNVGAGALGSATLVLKGTMLTLVFSAPDYDRPTLTLEFDLTSPTSATLTAPRQLVLGFPRCPLPSHGVSPPQPDASFASYGSLTYNASTLFVSATLVLADGGYAGCGGPADLTIACTRGDGG